MLVFSRKPGESFHIGDNIIVKVLQVRPGRCRLAIEAPREVQVRRPEAAPPTSPEHTPVVPPGD